MSSVPLCGVNETNPRPSRVETPLRPPMASHANAAAIQDSDEPLGTECESECESKGSRTVINYISGGQGGSGGGGGFQGYGGAGGAGEGPILQYDMKAERIVVKNFISHETVPSDWVRIPLGHVDLRNEIRMDGVTGAVWRGHGRKRVRRMYSARVVGHTEPMTVALYQGNNADDVWKLYHRSFDLLTCDFQEWRRDISRHSGLRHPHILQIYASACLSGIYATVFHDGATVITIVHLLSLIVHDAGDLVLFSQFLYSFGDSAVLRAYILWYTTADWRNVYDYKPVSSTGEVFQICWIRRSTGHLCIEFSAVHTYDGFFRVSNNTESPPQSMLNLHDPNLEAR
ncbi:hypothetical protein C8R45DRAFT_1217361, partial [Mycena sanguinolenta]